MKRLILSVFRQYLFWIFFFFILRAIFLLYHIPMVRQEGIRAGEAFGVFWHSLKLDTATAGYLLIFPVIVLLWQGLFRASWLNWVNRIYTLILVIAWLVITAVELGSFSEWKYKLTTGAFIHLNNFREAYYSIKAWQFFSLLAFVGLFSWLVGYAYSKWFYLKMKDKVRPVWKPLAFFVFSIPCLFVMLRGGINDISISASAAFYSNHSILNWTSVNSGYHFAVNVMETSRYKKSGTYDFFPLEEAKATVDQILRVQKDTTVSILKLNRPNIVILLMESWTADIIESLGAEPGITPEFAKLEPGGILFSRFYSAGNRSHEGTASLLGGLPALPYTTYTANPVKFPGLPSIVPILNDAGYHTSFYYGGQLDYGNMRAYLLASQIRMIVEENDIQREIPRGRLGVHDEYLYARHLEDLKTMQQPFFSVLFTLSSHSPYDFPMEPVIDWGGTEKDFLNSAYYADQCLGEYFRNARQQPWYDSTLFIIVADHGHNSYKNWKYESYEYHRVPLFFYGNVIREEFRGLQSDRIADNSSVAKTLLRQLGLPADRFKWGSDLFNPYSPSFAYVVLNDGYMWKTPEGEIVFSMMWNYYYSQQFAEGVSEQRKEAFKREGKSYVQVLFREFLDL